ncbi:hypothetical protein FBUS_01590 [Fasciolopsis buskii]|uniref:Uncharacterized protein n=1 Tax=Fasciolopsis buskii TaxID=27845 RepID=A0A8E0RTF7_9TREM|nr:hypothetical protein FBUS_01590 [Fasciolopsis buski]
MRRTPLNESARTLSQIRVSSNGLYFTAQWYTGYEPFGASAIKEAPTRQLINHLTRAVVNASEYETTEFVQAFRMDPDAGLALWYIEPGEGSNGSASQVVSEITVGIVYTIAPPRHSRLISRLLLFVSLAHLWLTVYLVWHSHMTMTHGWNAHEDDHQHVRSQFTSNDLASVHLVRKSRSLDTQTTKSAKQHQVPTSTYRMKVKDKFLNATQSPLYLLHPTPPFGDRPVANVVLRLISFTATMSIAGSAKKSDQTSSGKSAMGTAGSLSQSQIDWDSVGSGALVRFWFPPYLNERHLKSYPLIINVALSENYHYIERNRTALIGSPGLPSHLAGLLLSSEKAALNPSCGLLLAPVTRWGMHGKSTQSQRNKNHRT